MTEGFLYIATGQKYIEEARTSAKSLRRHFENAKIALVTDKPINDNLFNEIIFLEPSHTSNWKLGLNFKVEGLLKSPFEKTFFIDTDTYFTDSTIELFRLLDFFDLLICHSPNDISKIRVKGKKLEGLSPYNTGVIVFNKNTEVIKLFKEWGRFYLEKPETYSSDQPAFMEALLTHDVKIFVLSYVYNFRLPSFISLPPLKVKIIHGRASNYERLNRIINRHSDRHRTWSPYWGKIFKNYRRFQSTKKVLINVLGREKFNKLKRKLKG